MKAERQHLVINGRFLMQPTTGVQRVARELTREFDRMLAEGEITARIRLVCEAHADVSDLSLSMIEVEKVGTSRGHQWEQTVLPGHVKGGRLLCLGNTAPIVSLLGNPPVALMIHDLSYRLFPGAYTRRYRLGHAMLMPLLLRNSAPIFTVSETEKAMLSSLYPTVQDRIVVVQNGGWRDHEVSIPAADAAPAKDSYALYVGSFSRRKNIDGVISTAIRLAREDGLPTVFAGSEGSFLTPPEVEIPDDVKSMIRFVGQVENLKQLGNLYRNAACLIFPSFYEASPLPPLEAMNFGCPVIASDIASLRERCGDAAEYCDPHHVADIVRAVRRVTRDDKRAAELREHGFAQCAQYSWRKQAEKILSTLLAS